MFELIGPDKPGQALGYGIGDTKSKVTKLSLDLRRSRKESLINQNRLMLDKIESQGRKIESQNNQMKFMAKDLSDIRGELNVLTTAFKNMLLEHPNICSFKRHVKTYIRSNNNNTDTIYTICGKLCGNLVCKHLLEFIITRYQSHLKGKQHVSNNHF